MLTGILVSGCIGWVSESEVPEKSEGLRSQVVVGQTSREAVHERLGEPFISEEKIEVYRVLEDPTVTVILPTWEALEVILYALVAYDKNGVVEDIDWAIYQSYSESADYPNYPKHETRIRAARLQAGGYYFAAFGVYRPILPSKREEILLAPPSISRRALEASPPPGMCSVVVFLKPLEGGEGFKRLMHLDGEPVFEIPLVNRQHWWLPSPVYWYPYYQRIFAKLLVSEGGHELKITTGYRPWEFHREFDCKGDEVFYVYPRHKLVDSEPYGFTPSKKTMFEGDIEISNQPLESYDGWKRLLFYSGKWFGED